MVHAAWADASSVEKCFERGPSLPDRAGRGREGALGSASWFIRCDRRDDRDCACPDESARLVTPARRLMRKTLLLTLIALAGALATGLSQHATVSASTTAEILKSSTDREALERTAVALARS